jgi:hypothetical protein
VLSLSGQHLSELCLWVVSGQQLVSSSCLHKEHILCCHAGKTLWTTITSHIQPHLCALSALADLLLFNILHMELPVLQLISRGDSRWRQVHLLWQDLGASLQQLEYRELAGQLARTMQRMLEPLCKSKVMHLLRWVLGLWSLLPVQLLFAARCLQHGACCG